MVAGTAEHPSVRVGRLACSIAVVSSKAVSPLGSLTVAAPYVRAQGRAPVKIRYNEVVRSILYAPAYVALTKGYFKDAGLDITLATAQGGDKSVAALLSNSADIALIGPESAIYVQNSDLPTKIPIFCGLTATDGFMLVGREKVDKFDWSMLKGKEILGFRPGTTPLLFLEAALRQNGIDPLKDVKLNNNVAIPARVGSWIAGQNQFAHLHRAGRLAARARRQGALPRLDRRDRGAGRLHDLHGDRQIHQRESRGDPDLHRRDLQGAEMDRCRSRRRRSPRRSRDVLPGRESDKALVAAAERYRKLNIWKATPKIEPKAMDKFQDILVQGNVLDNDKRVKFETLVLSEFANKAK